MTDVEALSVLLGEARTQENLLSYLKSLLRRAEPDPSNLHRLAECLVTAAGAMNQKLAETSRKGKLRCSFCLKRQRDVRKLIAGTHANICDECVGICVETLKEVAQPVGPGGVG
jgi:hypothetical protein